MLEKHILGHQNNKQTSFAHNYLEVSHNQNKKNSRLKQVLVVLMVGMLGLFGVFQFFKSPALTVRKTVVSGIRSVSLDLVMSDISTYLQASTKLGFLKGNVFLFNKKAFSNYLLDHYPSFKHVRTEFTSPYQVTVYVQEYSPQYLWCGQSCVFADNSGYLYQYANSFTPGSFIIFNGALREDNFEIRNNIFHGEHEKILLDSFLGKLKERGIHVQAVNNINTHDITFLTDTWNNIVLAKNTEIRITSKQDVEYLTSMLDILSHDSEFYNSIIQKNNLSYIDLRYPDKIFYKFNAAPQQTVTASQ